MKRSGQPYKFEFIAVVIEYSKSHNLQIDDALIAATSIKKNIELITYNISDFKFIPNLKFYQFGCHQKR